MAKKSPPSSATRMEQNAISQSAPRNAAGRARCHLAAAERSTGTFDP